MAERLGYEKVFDHLGGRASFYHRKRTDRLWAGSICLSTDWHGNIYGVGMLVSSLLIGVFSIKGSYVRTLAMAFFGIGGVWMCVLALCIYRSGRVRVLEETHE